MKINLYACAVLALSFFFDLNANAQISNAGLIAHWMFNGNAGDSSGNGNHGTANNITYTTGISGQPNTAAVFNGASYITVPYNSILNVDSYSICAKIWIDSFYTGTCQENMILERGPQYGTGNYGMWFGDTVSDCSPTSADTGAYTFVTELGPNNPSIPFNSWGYRPTVRTGRWYSVIGTWNGDTTKLYLNGGHTVSVVPNSITAIGSSSDGITIGSGYNYGSAPNSSFPYPFIGKMDDLRIYNRVLTDAEIRAYTGSPVTVEKTAGKSILQVYPNPSSGTFRVSANMDSPGDAILEVFDIVGKIVYAETVPVYNNTINKQVDLENINAGTYLLRIRSNAEIATRVITIDK